MSLAEFVYIVAALDVTLANTGSVRFADERSKQAKASLR